MSTVKSMTTSKASQTTMQGESEFQDSDRAPGQSQYRPPEDYLVEKKVSKVISQRTHKSFRED